VALIDFHCHLDLYPDPRAVVAHCVERRVYVLSVTTAPSAFEGTAALAVGADRIRTALGLHPELAIGRKRELPLFEKLLPQTRYVGEVGLDGSRDHRASLDQQTGVLEDILGMCVRAGGRVISLHSRGATGAILDVLKTHTAAGTFVLHWYLGSARQVTRAAEMGCWFSVGPTMLTSVRGRAAAAAMPRDRVIPESDGPFGLLDGQPASPWDASSMVPYLAGMWGEPEQEVETQLLSNFRGLVRRTEATAERPSLSEPLQRSTRRE
jgi:TatD DNase family protein